MAKQNQVGMLEITILGPFVYEQTQHHLWAYAPCCDNHVVAATTVFSETPLPGKGEDPPSWRVKGKKPRRRAPSARKTSKARRYAFEFTQASSTTDVMETPAVPVEIFSVKARPPKPGDCYLSLRLPKPGAIIGIHAVMAAIGRKTSRRPWASAARLYYESVDFSLPVAVKMKGQEDRFCFDFDVSNKADGHGDLTIQHLGPVRDDISHREAISCFRHTAQLIGKDLNFTPGIQTRLTAGNDCHGAVIQLVPD